MNARIKATGILGFIFVAFSVIYCEIVINYVAEKRPVLGRIKEIQ